jgi:hypothetical protein
MYSAQIGNLTIAQYLLEHKADINNSMNAYANFDALFIAMGRSFGPDRNIFAFLSCNTDAKNVHIEYSVTPSVRDAFIEEYKHIQRPSLHRRVPRHLGSRALGKCGGGHACGSQRERHLPRTSRASATIPRHEHEQRPSGQHEHRWRSQASSDSWSPAQRQPLVRQVHEPINIRVRRVNENEVIKEGRRSQLPQNTWYVGVGLASGEIALVLPPCKPSKKMWWQSMPPNQLLECVLGIILNQLSESSRLLLNNHRASV